MKGPKHIYAQEHKLYYGYYYFGGHSEDINWKTITRQSVQSGQRLQVEWLLLSLNENAKHIKESWVEIKPFEF